MSRNERIDEIPIRPIEQHRRDIVVPNLPSWHGKPVQIKIDVTLLDRAGLVGYQAWNGITIGTKAAWLLIVFAFKLDEILKQYKGKGTMQALAIAVRVVGWAAAAGGLLTGVFGADVALVIAAFGQVAKDGLTKLGDYLDNKKMDDSFKP